MSTSHSDIVEAAEAVHEELGPGHTESVYHRALEYEFSNNDIQFSSETTVTIFYKGMPVGTRRPDMMVETDDGNIIIELKSGTERGEEQLRSYIQILEDDANFEVDSGMLIQFNDELLITET